MLQVTKRKYSSNTGRNSTQRHSGNLSVIFRSKKVAILIAHHVERASGLGPHSVQQIAVKMLSSERHQTAEPLTLCNLLAPQTVALGLQGQVLGNEARNLYPDTGEDTEMSYPHALGDDTEM
jgi:hypothetical protein